MIVINLLFYLISNNVAEKLNALYVYMLIVNNIVQA